MYGRERPHELRCEEYARPQTNYWCESEDRYFFHNAFSMFRTSYLKKYPFDEHYSGKEDRYWANNQIENGFEILYDSEQEVKHQIAQFSSPIID